jgi:hypothetical protein
MAFIYKLEHEDGTPADPPTFRSAPGTSWNAGDTIPLGAKTLRVVGIRDDDADQPSRLVVEDVDVDAGLPSSPAYAGASPGILNFLARPV